MTSSHPYYPQHAVLSGQVFTPNTWSVAFLITTFGLAWTVILATTLLLVRRWKPNLRITDQVLVLWFVLTGSIHLFFEGYFILNHTHIASTNTYFGQLWKEYALSDSRYMTSDPFLLSIERFTVTIIAPLSLLTSLAIHLTSPHRHALQALVSTLHCYGNALYFSTSLLEEQRSGHVYYRPEWMYFWVYFVGMNGIWFVVPGWCLYSSIKASARAFRLQQSVTTEESINLLAKKSK